MTRTRWRLLPLLLAAAVGAAAAPGPAARAGSSPPPDVVADWSVIAERTVYAEALAPVPVGAQWLAFTSLAVYDAVVAVEGRYVPYAAQPAPDGPADARAAAVVAAHDVLAHYAPGSTAALAADQAASLAELPPGAARDRGGEVGRAAAQRMIDLRADDGSGADITLDVRPAPGVWRPTPDLFAPMLVPWLGFTEPLLLPSPTTYAPSPPHPLTSAVYARQLRQVERYGALEGSRRSAWQTETALFWNSNAVQQYRAALRDQVARRGLDLVDSARATAALGASTADALISCWRAKYDSPSWRPVTALRRAHVDGNPATHRRSDWLPLIPTPPYPEHSSGHACATGAATETLGQLFGAHGTDLRVESAVTGTVRRFDDLARLDAQAMKGRIWLGIHVRKAVADGNRLGHQVAEHALRVAFQPVP